MKRPANPPAFVPTPTAHAFSPSSTLSHPRAACRPPFPASSFLPRPVNPMTLLPTAVPVLADTQNLNAPIRMSLKERANRPSTCTDARRQQLASVIVNGAVFKMADMSLEMQPGCSLEMNGRCLDDWLQLGGVLEDALGAESDDVRVYQYYLPIYFWVLRELKGHLAYIAERGATPRPFILGICCPQGGGKTTMTRFLSLLLSVAGFTAEVASLDDFYVTNAEQRMIAAKHVDNRLLQFRGMPGTHDIPLLIRTLDALRKGEEAWVPRYDKTAFGGRGDRAPKENWTHIGASVVDVVLLEGWCMGFEQVPVDTLIDEDLSEVNDALCVFGSIYTRLDGLFVIEIEDMDWVYSWRLQAERATRAAGRKGLSDEEVTDFVSRFMPAYKQYSPALYNRKTPLCPRHELHIAIDRDRKPVLRKDL